MDRKILGTRVKELRIKKNLTQSDIADLLGVKKQQISMLETGNATTTIERLYTLADIFDTSMDYLAGRTNIKKITIEEE